MSNVFIGQGSVVDSCIVDEAVSVGRLCYVGFGAATASSHPQITVLGQGTTVAHRSRIFPSRRVGMQAGRDGFPEGATPAGAPVSASNAANVVLVGQT
jgi:hypothetical protein